MNDDDILLLSQSHIDRKRVRDAILAEVIFIPPPEKRTDLIPISLFNSFRQLFPKSLYQRAENQLILRRETIFGGWGSTRL